jgi:hypothetical protein
MISLVPECYDASGMRDTYAPNWETLGNKLQVRGCQIGIVVAVSDSLDNTYFDYYTQDAEGREPLVNLWAENIVGAKSKLSIALARTLNSSLSNYSCWAATQASRL